MSKNDKASKAKPQPRGKNMFAVIIALVVLLIIAIGVILFMLLSSNSADDISDIGPGNFSGSGYEVSDDKSQSSQSEYGKDNPVITITDRSTPVLTSEEEGVFTQKAEVNVYCDLQDGYEISSTSGKAYKGDKPTKSQMDYENSQSYHKYSQYGSVGLTCTGHGSYRKSDKWGLQAALGHGVTIVDDDANDGRFSFTVDAWLNADGSTKESRDFAKKVLMITSNGDTELPTILERYYMELDFILNRDAQEFLDSWQKTINTR